MKMKLRKFITMFMIMAMTAGLTVGCGSSSSEEGDVAWDSSMDITIVSREDGSGTRGAFIELFGIEVKDESGEKKRDIKKLLKLAKPCLTYFKDFLKEEEGPILILAFAVVSYS